MKCQHCGSMVSPDEFVVKSKSQGEDISEMDMTLFTCSGCGAASYGCGVCRRQEKAGRTVPDCAAGEKNWKAGLLPAVFSQKRRMSPLQTASWM